MDNAHQRHPYRCLPLVIANQCGLGAALARRRSGRTGTAGPAKEDVEVRFDGPPDNRIVSHFGSGVITFTVPFLFRTPPGINLWVKGPAQLDQGRRPAARRGGRDRLARVHVHDELEDDPGVRVGAVREGRAVLHAGAGAARAGREPRAAARCRSTANPELQAQYQTWEESRNGFLTGLTTRDPEAVKQGWQKDYFQGKTPDGKDVRRRTRRGSTCASSRSWRRRRSRPPRGRGS